VLSVLTTFFTFTVGFSGFWNVNCDGLLVLCYALSVLMEFINAKCKWIQLSFSWVVSQSLELCGEVYWLDCHKLKHTLILYAFEIDRIA
jgi:hypothetical protein